MGCWFGTNKQASNCPDDAPTQQELDDAAQELQATCEAAQDSNVLRGNRVKEFALERRRQKQGKCR